MKRYYFAPTTEQLQLPTNGLRLHLEPDSIESVGILVTGWRNKIDGAVLGTLNPANPTYTAADPDFNGLGSVRTDSNAILDGYVMTSTVGWTILHVSAFAPFSYVDTMPWFANVGGIPLDMWSPDPGALYYNTFGGSQYGHNFNPNPSNRDRPHVYAYTIPQMDIQAARIYRDGVQLSMNVNTSNLTEPNFTSAPKLYPGYVSVSSNYSFQGRHSSFLAWDRVLTPTEMQQAQQYMLTRYQIPPSNVAD